MTNSAWAPLVKVADLVASESWDTVAPKVDAYIAASLEAIADVMPTATGVTLREGAAAARTAFETLAAKTGIDEVSAEFAAGRLAAAVDLLGYAGHQSGDEGVLTLAARQPYAALLDALAQKPMRNADLVRHLGRDKAQVSRFLAALREKGAVTSHRQGRELYNALTPVGRLVVAKGIEDRTRAPLAQSRVYALDAVRDSFNLGIRTPPADAKQTTPARISASAA